VASWDQVARRWVVIFDAQKVKPPTFSFGVESSNAGIRGLNGTPDEQTPILDPRAQAEVKRVVFVRFRPGKGETLVFSTSSNYGGSGVPGSLVALDVSHGEANITYYWGGDGGASFNVLGKAPNQRLRARAFYWTDVDAHCCPVRSYLFTIAAAPNRSIGVVSDQRPWLGVYVSPAPEYSRAALRVLGVVDGSPAHGSLQKGDVLLGLKNAPPLKAQPGLGPSLLDELSSLNSGQTARLSVLRGGSTFTVGIKLRSLGDESTINAIPPNDYSVSTV
jgi:hypothetical protein